MLSSSTFQRGSRAHAATALALGAVLGTVLANPASAQGNHARKRCHPVCRTGGPPAACQDQGNVSVIVDNGLIVTQQNPFDLNGRAVRFEPAGNNLYTVSSSTAALDPAFGPALTFGHPAVTLFPGDDDTQSVAFAAGFPFFGTTYTSVWVNTDGNVTFGVPEFASDDRDKSKQLLGPPRISAYLLDVNATSARNLIWPTR